MCLAQGHNAVTPVRLKPPASRSQVKHSTTEPLRSLYFLNYGREKIKKIVGCKTIDYLVEDDEFMFILTVPNLRQIAGFR